MVGSLTTEGRKKWVRELEPWEPERSISKNTKKKKRSGQIFS